MSERLNHCEQEPKPISSQWLTGAFEAGGGMGFHIHKGRRGNSLAYPYVQMGDILPQGIQYLHYNFGGTYAQRKSGGHRWLLEGQKVSSIVDVLSETYSDHASWRKPVYKMFTAWLASNDIEERLDIAQSSEVSSQHYVPAQDYEDLVQNPNFMAGILDFRTSLYPVAPNGTTQPRLSFASKNVELLEAIHNVYGGSIHRNTTSLEINKMATISDILASCWPQLVNSEKFMLSSNIR